MGSEERRDESNGEEKRLILYSLLREREESGKRDEGENGSRGEVTVSLTRRLRNT